MPEPSVEPIPRPPTEFRLPVPLEAQDASYLAASARMASLRFVFTVRIYSDSIIPSTVSASAGGCWRLPGGKSPRPHFHGDVADRRDRQRRQVVQRSVTDQGGQDLALGQAVREQCDEHR